jgi:hypothetical protein
MYGIWAKGAPVPNAPKEPRKAARIPRGTFEQAFWKARHDEVVRLGHEHLPTAVPGLARAGVEDRPIVSMTVYLYERNPPSLIFPRASVANRTRVWEYETSAGKKVILSPLAQGTLHLTRRQLIFSSAQRSRVFALDQLTHLSATKSGIAVATRGRGAISYFSGICTANITFEVVRGPSETWPDVQCTFSFTGYEIKEIVRILLSTSARQQS